MDFLDPEKKRAHAIKLAIGHFLMAVLVLVGTYILVFRAYGFDVDRKTGQIIQNGLVFVDSAPDGAEIKINGVVNREKTNVRLALPEGQYELELNKPGYRSWKKSFDMAGGFIERFNYPTLFLNELAVSELQTFDSTITFMTQSPDRRWVLIGAQENVSTLTEYDLNTLENEQPVRKEIPLPDDLFSAGSGSHSLKMVEWSTDNKHLLVQHRWSGGSEFLILNRDLPSASINVNKTLGKNPSSVRLRDKKIDDLYLIEGSSRTLSRINVASKSSTSLAERVINFEPHGADVLLYAASNQQDRTKAQVFLRDGNDNHEVRTVQAAPSIPLAIARYDNEWYVAAPDPGENKTYIYRDPAGFYKNERDGLKQAPIMVLRNAGLISGLEFSGNAQFIASWSGQNFSVYDIEYARSFRFDVKPAFDRGSEVEWMDGHRFIARSGSKIVVFEFDGANQQTLVAASPTLPVAFNRDYTTLYGVTTSAAKKSVFTQTQLRLEEDR